MELPTTVALPSKPALVWLAELLPLTMALLVLVAGVAALALGDEPEEGIMVVGAVVVGGPLLFGAVPPLMSLFRLAGGRLALVVMHALATPMCCCGMFGSLAQPAEYAPHSTDVAIPYLVGSLGCPFVYAVLSGSLAVYLARNASARAWYAGQT